MRDRHEEARLSAFLDDELSDDDALIVTRHLLRCEFCLGELETLRQTRSAVRGLPQVDPPPTLWERLDVAALAAPGEGRTVVAAVAALVLVLTVYLLMATGAGKVVPDLDELTVDTATENGAILVPAELEP